VAQILSAGFARIAGRFVALPMGIASRVIVVFGLSLLVSGACAAAQSVPSTSASQAKKNKAIASVVAQPPAAVQLQAHPTSAPVLTPPLPPVVEWDGRKLTIDAENSTLSDILLAIRSHTGASMDMPGSASAERVAVHLGPAPIREVLASLLYGTDFDYVIQGSDTDEFGLKSVTVTARGKSDDSDALQAPQQAGGVRLMPGYAAPGKRTYEVMHASAADNTASTTDTSTGSNPSPSVEESASATGDPASSATAANNGDAQSSPSSPESADASAPLAGPSPSAPNTETSSAEASPSVSDPMSQMEQNLQHLYQQRQKIQAQQNQGAQPAGK